jgi:hypothetical protein
MTIFPEEKRQLIKFLDQHSAQLHWPDWVIAVIRQLVAESDAAEKRIGELTDRQIERIRRIDRLITTYKLKLQETGWKLNADGEWVKPLAGDELQETLDKQIECWM